MKKINIIKSKYNTVRKPFAGDKHFLLILILAIICSCTLVSAQTLKGFGITYGNGIRVLESRLGLTVRAGVTGSVEFSERISVDPELVYALKGYGDDGIILDGNSTDIGTIKRLNLHYVDFTLPVKYRIINTLQLVGGPQVGYLCNAHYKYNGNTYENDDLTDEYKSFDFGILLGAEIAYSNGWGIQFLANPGLISPGKTEKISMNFITTVGFYYLFPIKSENN